MQCSLKSIFLEESWISFVSASHPLRQLNLKDAKFIFERSVCIQDWTIQCKIFIADWVTCIFRCYSMLMLQRFLSGRHHLPILSPRWCQAANSQPWVRCSSKVSNSSAKNTLAQSRSDITVPPQAPHGRNIPYIVLRWRRHKFPKVLLTPMRKWTMSVDIS